MPKDDATWLNVCYVIAGILGAYLGFKVANTVGIETGWLERYDDWYPLLQTVLSFSIGGGTYFYLKSDKENNEYHLSAISELRKVTWPSWDDTKKMTLVVVIVVIIVSAALSVFDVGWSWALKQILA